MQLKTLATFAAIAVLLVGCSSGSSNPVSIGKSVVSPTRNETVQAFAEQVLTQSSSNSSRQGVATVVVTVAVGALKVCIPAQAKTQVVRASDYELLLANGKHIAGTTGPVSPPLLDGRVSPGSCVRGWVDWVVPAHNHPTIVDERTGASWKPNCPQTTSSTGPCEKHVLPPPQHL